MNMVRNLFQKEGGKSILFIFFLDFCPFMTYNYHMKGSDGMDKRAITDRLDYAIRIIEGVVECQESVDDLGVANQLISEAIDQLKTCESRWY